PPPTRRGCHPSTRTTRDIGRVTRPCLALLRVGFAEPPGSPRALVRSYRTVSPLPVGPEPPSAVCSLLHFPAGHPDWPLASTLPCGAPTFLDPVLPGRDHPAGSPHPLSHEQGPSPTSTAKPVNVPIAGEPSEARR